MSEAATEFAELMARVRAGCPEAMQEVCERYGAHLRRVVRRKLDQRLRTQFDSLDFLQDVWASFVAVPPERYTFETQEELVLFLTRVASNKVTEAYRRRLGTKKRNPGLELPLEEKVPAPTGRQPTASQVAMADERWVQLLEGLTPVQKQIVDLLRQGHTHQEISTMLGLHVKAIQRLIRKLSEQLES